MPITYQVPFGDTAGAVFGVADDETHMCPFDGSVMFFVLYHAKGSRAPGLYVWNWILRQWDRVADLDDLPAGEWCSVSDGNGDLIPLRLCRSPSGAATAVWSQEAL